MSSETAHLFEQALRLPERERADLAAKLLDSLDPGTEADVEKAWADEIKRRIDELDSGQTTTIPWEEVKRRILDISDDESEC